MDRNIYSFYALLRFAGFSFKEALETVEKVHHINFRTTANILEWINEYVRDWREIHNAYTAFSRLAHTST